MSGGDWSVEGLASTKAALALSDTWLPLCKHPEEGLRRATCQTVRLFKKSELCLKNCLRRNKGVIWGGGRQQVAGWSRPVSGIPYMKVHFPSYSVVWQVHRPDNSASGRLCGELKYYQSSYCTLSKTPFYSFPLVILVHRSGFLLTVKFKLLLLLYREY